MPGNKRFSGRSACVFVGVDLLAGAAAAATLPLTARAQAKPRVTFISQWSRAATARRSPALGKQFEEEGGIWQHSPVPGFTTEMMNKLRAQIIAGDPPAASQLKGPEIAAWSKIAPTVDLDPLVEAAGYEKLVPAELVGLHKPQGHWIALPMQVYRTNTLFMSDRRWTRSAPTKAPDDLGGVQRARREDEGGRHHPGRQWRHPLGRRHEVRDRARRHQPRRPIARALMKLDAKALKGAEMLAAFAQLRKLANWMDPNIAAQHYSVNLPNVHQGRDGHADDGRLGAGRDQERRRQARATS